MSLNLRLSHAKNELVARECQIKELTKETLELKRENSDLHGRQVFCGGGGRGEGGGRGRSSGDMARSGSSNKVGSGRNKGKMAPQDGKDLKREKLSQKK